MKKFPFIYLKGIMLSQEIQLLDDMEVDGGDDYSEDKLELINDFNDAKNINDIVKLYVDRGHDEEDVYMEIIKQFVELS